MKRANKGKPVLVMLIVAVMIFVAGCSVKSNNDSTAGSASSSESPTAGSTASASPSASASDANKPELRMLVPFEHIDHNTDPVAKYLEQATGYKVKYEQLPEDQTQADSKLNLMMANGEAFDILKMTQSQFFTLAAQGALEPLDDLLAKYGQDVTKAISSKSFEGTKIKGKIYAIPETGEGPSVPTELAIRQDWMDELGLKMPTTRDELYTVLKTIKEKKKVIPLIGYEDVYPFIASSFDIDNNYWVDAGGKIQNNGVENPRMKDYLAYMSKLYKEGLIDSEWPINEGAKVIEKFTSGKAAMYSMAWWEAPSVVNALTKNAPNAKIGLVPFLKDDSGKPGPIGITGGIQAYIGIPKSSKYKEETMKYIDIKLTPDIFKGMTIGQEGVHFEIKDGKYFPILPKFSDERNSSSWFMTGSDENVYPQYWQARVRKNPVLTQYYEKIQENGKGLTVLNPLSFAPPIDAVSKNLQKLVKFQRDNLLLFMTGKSLDTYDAFLAKWRKDGGDAMIQGANDWYKNK
jgi:putative aldouronate transport system substrate-binding protein